MAPSHREIQYDRVVIRIGERFVSDVGSVVPDQGDPVGEVVADAPAYNFVPSSIAGLDPPLVAPTNSR